MAYDANYYKQKKDKVLRKIQRSKDIFLQRQVDEMNRFLAEQRELQSDIAEINQEEQKSKTENKKEESKKNAKRNI